MKLTDMKLGIVGGGVVGHATARAFAEHVRDIRVHDIDPTRRTTTLASVLRSDLVFVCLPTPSKPDGTCDTSALDAFLGSVRVNGGHDKTNLVIKSTVPVGYTRRAAFDHALANLVHSPEFLTARCAVLDASLPSRNVIGVPDFEGYEEQSDCPGTLLKVYTQRWPHVPVLSMTSDASEAAKLALNSFFAVKVAYWNEVRQLADKLGIDWNDMMSVIRLDGRVHPSHTEVPGPDGRFGFGGACLPKDLNNLRTTMIQAGLFPFVTAAACARNHKDRERTV